MSSFQDYYKEIDILCHEEDDESFNKDMKTFVLCNFFDTPYDFSSQEELDKKYREEYYRKKFIQLILRNVFE
jgi:hypothetical protein